MTSTEYELFLKKHFEDKLQRDLGRYIEVKHKEILLTPTRREYEIDLNYELKIAGARHLVIIECKCWKDKVTRAIADQFCNIINGIKAHKGIIVTTVGFDSGAIELAKEEGMALLKMTTTGKFEEVHNFTGVDKNLLIQKLQESTFINDEEIIQDGFGIAFPKMSVVEYIMQNYGRSFLDILVKFENELDEFDNNSIDSLTKEIINKVPYNWGETYCQIETGGLQCLLSNEFEFRAFSRIVLMLKIALD